MGNNTFNAKLCQHLAAPMKIIDSYEFKNTIAAQEKVWCTIIWIQIALFLNCHLALGYPYELQDTGPRLCPVLSFIFTLIVLVLSLVAIYNLNDQYDSIIIVITKDITYISNL